MYSIEAVNTLITTDERIARALLETSGIFRGPDDPRSAVATLIDHARGDMPGAIESPRPDRTTPLAY